MLIDTHAHLNFSAYKEDLEKVIKRTIESDIAVINVGSKYETSKKAVEIAEKYASLYAAIGLHPIHSTAGLVKVKTDPEEGGFIAQGEEFDKEKYKSLAQSKKVVAIGEIGLDYYYRPKTKKKLQLFKQKQKDCFIKQLDLAKELNLPVILHCRMAHQELLEILKFQASRFKFQGVIHCFSGGWKEAKKYLEMGFYLGFNGIIYKLDLKEVIEKTPLDKILLETDCPYLTPPQAEVERNEPCFVKYVAQEIAKLKKLDFSKIAEITTKNAKNLFQI